MPATPAAPTDEFVTKDQFIEFLDLILESEDWTGIVASAGITKEDVLGVKGEPYPSAA